MMILLQSALVTAWLVASTTHAFSHPAARTTTTTTSTSRRTTTTTSHTQPVRQNRKQQSRLYVSIGLGPGQQEDDADTTATVMESTIERTYEIPDHEAYRTSRRSKMDEQCDAWFGKLLNSGENNSVGCLGPVAEQARTILTTPVALVNEEEKDVEDPEWTPYVSTKLPWTPLTPAFGLEEFGLPIPRRNAETWRHFDVPGLVGQDYSASTSAAATVESLDLDQVQEQLAAAGGWLSNEECEARLVYVDGQFVPDLSKTTKHVYNLDGLPSSSSDSDDTDDKEAALLRQHLGRLTDGFTDTLAAPVPSGDTEFLTSYAKLSVPDHNLGDPTSQFAVNTQQGTACFAALNTVKCTGVALVHYPNADAAEKEEEDDNDQVVPPKPVLIVQAQTPTGGAERNSDSSDEQAQPVGVAVHPRTLVVAGDNRRLSVVQSCVDLTVSSSDDDNDDAEQPVPKLYNGYTQIFVGAGANVTHSYLEEMGGMVVGGTEKADDEFVAANRPIAREVEATRPALRDSHLEAIDVHVTGEAGAYQGTLMSVGGSGRVRLAHSITLLQTGAHADVNGFSLSGGAQRTDMKTNIHHIAQGTTSQQVQKNMIGGRAVGAFRGRIRVEQSAQQTDSSQLSRTVLLSDKARAWAVPSLEIIADDVQCAHGATVSDLSEEELFYLRSRGLDVATSRNLLMYAFAGDISATVDSAMLGSVDSAEGLQQRVIARLENLVPQGERAVKGEFQSI